MLSDQFTQIFREEHRQVRDLLLNLIPAFKARDRSRLQSLLSQIASLTGPHFRYEEEALYPLLTDFFGEEYVEKLYSDHDRAIASAKRLVELAGKESLSDAEISEAVRLIRGILPHVSDCDGLSIMVETVPEEKVQTILNTRERSLKEGLNLLEWSEKVRAR